MLSTIRGALAALALVVAFATVAHATTFRNPAPRFDSGDVGVGLGISDDRETIFADFGIGADGVLEVFAGNLDIFPGLDGTEFGAGYRHDLGETNQFNGMPLHIGILGQFHVGQADDDAIEVDYQQIDVGGGATLRVNETVDVFGIVVFHHVEIESDVTINVGGNRIGVGAETDDTDFGFIAGAEAHLAEAFIVGGELHFGIDGDDFAFYGELKF